MKDDLRPVCIENPVESTPGKEAMSPVQAIHAFCVACVGGSIYDVQDCGGDKCLNGGCDPGPDEGICWFYRFRMGTGRPPLKLLRKYCLYCTCGDQEYVLNCPDGIEHQGTSPCALHPFRMGKNPNISEETKQRRREVAIRSYTPGKFLQRRPLSNERGA